MTILLSQEIAQIFFMDTAGRLANTSDINLWSSDFFKAKQGNYALSSGSSGRSEGKDPSERTPIV
jgi:hypothetical protein